MTERIIARLECPWNDLPHDLQAAALAVCDAMSAASDVAAAKAATRCPEARLVIARMILSERHHRERIALNREPSP